MTNAAPWSVKGIDPRAREAAREAARRQGLTIGEWLNQAILANEAALAQARGEAPPAPYEPRGGSRDERLSEALQQLAERLDVNDRRNALAMTGLDRTLSSVAARVEQADHEVRSESGRVSDLLDELRDAQSVLIEQMRRLEQEDIPALQSEIDAPNDRIVAVEHDLRALSAKALAAEAATGDALKRLDGAMSSLDTKLAEAVSPAALDAQAAALKESFEASLDTMAQDVAGMVAEARADIAGQIVSALGGLQPEEMKEALGDMSRRLTAAERRHTQTIEAVSIEIKRLSESMDRRIRVVEARNDDGAVGELRDQFGAMAKTVETRLHDMEAREAAAFSRMGDEVGRIAERLDMRVSNSEARSAEAIEKVGEQVALMADRLSAKQDKFATEVAERIVQSEERQTGRLSQALSSISERLGAIDAGGGASPFAEAMTAFEARLKTIEEHAGVPVTLPDIEPPSAPIFIDPPPPPPPPAPQVKLEHEQDLHARYATPLVEPETYRRAGPLPDPEPEPETAAPAARETIYLEDIEEEFARREDEPQTPAYEMPPASRNLDDPFADIESAPPEDDEEDLFWSTGKPGNANEAAPETEAAPAAAAPPPTEAFSAPFEDEEPDDEDDFFLPPPSERAEDDAAKAEQDDVEQTVFGAGLDLEAPAPAAGDYLAAARRAAQANNQRSKAKKKERAAKADGDAPAAGLRGLTRVLLWGAAGAVMAAIAGGVYVYSSHSGQTHEGALEPEDARGALNAPPGSIAEGVARAAAEDVAPPAEATPLEGAAVTPARAGPLDAIAASAVSAQTIAAAYSTLEDAAMRGDPVAQYEYGLARLASGDSQNAVVYLRRAANQGLAMAQYRFGQAVRTRRGRSRSILRKRGNGPSARPSAATARRCTTSASITRAAKARRSTKRPRSNGSGRRRNTVWRIRNSISASSIRRAGA